MYGYCANIKGLSLELRIYNPQTLESWKLSELECYCQFYDDNSFDDIITFNWENEKVLQCNTEPITWLAAVAFVVCQILLFHCPKCVLYGYIWKMI